MRNNNNNNNLTNTTPCPHPPASFIQRTANYAIVSTRPPSDERAVFQEYWMFVIEGPGHCDKTFIGTHETCGEQFIQALQEAYDAGVVKGYDKGVLDTLKWKEDK